MFEDEPSAGFGPPGNAPRVLLGLALLSIETKRLESAHR
jgi:hypothetical protein